MSCGPLPSALKMTEEASNIYCNYDGPIVSTLTACTTGHYLENWTSQDTSHVTLPFLFFFLRGIALWNGLWENFLFTLHGYVDCQESWSFFLYFHSSHDPSGSPSDLPKLLVGTDGRDARKKRLASEEFVQGSVYPLLQHLCHKWYWRQRYAVSDLSVYLFEFHLVTYHWDGCSWILTHIFW